MGHKNNHFRNAAGQSRGLTHREQQCYDCYLDGLRLAVRQLWL
jgi:hypothetical protein